MLNVWKNVAKTNIENILILDDTDTSHPDAITMLCQIIFISYIALLSFVIVVIDYKSLCGCILYFWCISWTYSSQIKIHIITFQHSVYFVTISLLQ